MRVKPRGPLPTPAPAAELVAYRLEERQLDLADELCGYESGNIVSPLLCQSPYVCATNTVINARGCCTSPLASCYLNSACVDSTAISASCGPFCTSDQNVAKCSSSASPYCYTKYYSGESGPTQSEIGCTDISGVTVQAYLSYTFSSGILAGNLTSAGAAATGIATGLGTAAATDSSVFIPSSATPSSSSTASSASNTSASDSSNDGTSGGGGGLSQGAIIGIAVCATVVGLALIGLLFFFLWKKRKNNPSPQQYHNPNQPAPMMQTQQPPPPDVAGAFPHSGDAFHPNNFDSFNANFSQMDDDAVAKLRRFSNDGTIDQTVAGRTNDEYRPQPA